MLKVVNLTIHGFSFCFYPQHMKMLKNYIKNSVAKHVLLNKGVQNLPLPSFGWRTVQMAFYATFTPICQGTWGWDMVLSNKSWEMFSFKGSLSCAKIDEQTFVLSDAWWKYFRRMYHGSCGVTWDVMFGDWEREGFGVCSSLFLLWCSGHPQTVLDSEV